MSTPETTQRTDNQGGSDMTNNRDIHQQVLALLNGPTDYWDRPDCDWPGRAPQRDRTDDEVALARQSANTAYVMGSLALEQDNLDEAWTRFAMACDERHPGAAFRLAALTARRIGDRKAGSSGREAAGILAALCRAAEWGHTDAHRLVAPFITRTGPAAGTLSVGTSSTPIRTSLPALHTITDEPYVPQDPNYYAEILTFCGTLPAVGQTTSPITDAEQSEQASPTHSPVSADRLAKLTKWTSRDLASLEVLEHNLTGYPHELLIVRAECELLRRYLTHDARLRDYLRQARPEPLEPWPGRPLGPREDQCVLCDADCASRLQSRLAGRARFQCARTRERARNTELTTLPATQLDLPARPPHAAADSTPRTERTVKSARQLAPNASSLTEDSLPADEFTRADSVVALADKVSRLNWHVLVEGLVETVVVHSWSWFAAALRHASEPRPGSPAEDRLAALAPPTASSSEPVGTAWAELLHTSTLLPTVRSWTPPSAFHMVRNEENLYLFTATQADPHTQLALPSIIATLPSNATERTGPASELGRQRSAPAPPSTTTAHPIQVFELCP